jgi:hypothetical protein
MEGQRATMPRGEANSHLPYGCVKLLFKGRQHQARLLQPPQRGACVATPRCVQ